MKRLGAFCDEERGEEEGWNDRHEANQSRPAKAKRMKGSDVDERGQERLTALGEQEHRKEEENVVVEVEVRGEQKRCGEGGAEGDGEIAGGADEVDGSGEDENGEDQVEGEGDAGGKQARLRRRREGR